LQSKITNFIKDCQLGTLLNRSGIRKARGTSPLQLFTAIFMLPFEDNNFYRGIVTNKKLSFPLFLWGRVPLDFLCSFGDVPLGTPLIFYLLIFRWF
jgi:hypothetical protein